MPRFGLDLYSSDDDSVTSGQQQQQDSFDAEQSILARKSKGRASSLKPVRARRQDQHSRSPSQSSSQADTESEAEDGQDDANQNSESESASNSDLSSDQDMPPVSRLSADGEDDVSDEDDDVYRPPPSKKKGQRRKSRERQASRSTTSRSISASSASESGEDADNASHLAKESSPSVNEDEDMLQLVQTTKSPFVRRTLLAQQLKQDPARNKVMQVSMFPQSTARDPQENRQRLAASSRVPDTSRKALILPNLPEDQQSIALQGRQKDEQQNMPAPRKRTPRPFKRVAAEQSLLAGLDGYYKDTNLALGRSTRVGWAPSGIIACQGSVGGMSQAISDDFLLRPKLINLKKTPRTDASLQRARDAAIHSLQIQRKHTELAMTDIYATVAWTANTLRFHHFTAVGNDAQAQFEDSLYKLGHALYDELDLDLASEELSMAQQESLRRDARQLSLNRWLEDTCSSHVESDLRKIRSNTSDTNSERAVFQSIFALLSGHQIEKAVEHALSSGNLHLATLIAQAGAHGGASDQFRQDLFLQLTKWRENRSDAHVDVELRKIYELLSGNIALSEGFKPSDPVDGTAHLNMCRDLDWLRAFGVYRWYGQPQPVLSDTITRYEKACADSKTPPASPLPWYEAQHIKRQWKSASVPDERPADARFELLKLSANVSRGLETVLGARNYDASPLDVRLSWHLYMLLAKALAVADFDDRAPISEDDNEPTQTRSATADRLTGDYAAHLEDIGLWEWSAFVLNHLTYSECRERALKDLLTRNIHRLTPEGEQFLLTEICIPEIYIQEAKGLQAQLQGDLGSAAERFTAALLFDEAHQIIIQDLAPQAVLEEDFKHLIKLFEPLSEHEMYISEWQNGAQIYLDYTACISDLPRLLQDPEMYSHEIFRLAETVLPRLLHALPTFLAPADLKDRNLHRAAAVELMLEQCVQMRSAIAKNNPAETNIPVASLQQSQRVKYIAAATINVLNESLRDL